MTVVTYRVFALGLRSLSEKLKQEASPKAIVVLHKFVLPEEDGWQPYHEEDAMRFYHLPSESRDDEKDSELNDR